VSVDSVEINRDPEAAKNSHSQLRLRGAELSFNELYSSKQLERLPDRVVKKREQYIVIV
jgi:hypothetical protein